MKSLAVLCAVLILLPVGDVLAHGDELSLEQEVNGRTIDIGYEPELVADESIRFDLMVREREQELPFSVVWVRIGQGNTTYLATGVKQADIGRTVLSYRFPEGGVYDLSVRFETASSTVAEYSFPITVAAGDKALFDAKGISILALLVGLVGGFFGRKFITRKTS